jgi:hypothetical protein
MLLVVVVGVRARAGAFSPPTRYTIRARRATSIPQILFFFMQLTPHLTKMFV